MPEETHSIVNLTDADVSNLLKRAVRNTVILGVIPALAVGISTGWRNAAMLLTGAAISTASIWEWRRLIRIISAKMDKKQTPRGAALAVIFFLLRLTVFGAAIYGSLKCFHGSAIALGFGLSLAVVTLGWEALKLLKD
ncbi:MAG TPA: ATP synthase subunit I [Terracidiphilus sp.]|nr:ATP synthase subunit I [Terracidiphilus sp.]